MCEITSRVEWNKWNHIGNHILEVLNWIMRIGLAFKHNCVVIRVHESVISVKEPLIYIFFYLFIHLLIYSFIYWEVFLDVLAFSEII